MTAAPSYPCRGNRRRSCNAQARLTDWSSHRGEIDREPADVAPVSIPHDQRDPRRPREVPCGEAVDAAGEVPPVVLAHRRPLVLDEGRLDLAVADAQARRVEAREVLARAAERGDGEPASTHGFRPTTTRLNDSGAKNRAAARWTSLAVTRETPAL